MSTLKNLAGDFSIVLVDYVQRIPPDARRRGDPRAEINQTMQLLREIADEGAAVLVISSLSRGGEYRDSSEIEYGTDVGYKLSIDDSDPSLRRLECPGLCRYGLADDLCLRFDGEHQTFTEVS